MRARRTLPDSGPRGSASLGAVRAARLDRLLDVAETLFILHGFRAVTMESLADAAGIAKATLYGYLRDKETAFRGVADRLAGQIEDAVREALAQPGPLPDRLARALIAKHALVSARVRASPFAAELFAAKDRIVAGQFAQLDDRIEAMLATALAQAGVKRAAARSTARLLFGASQGIANRAGSSRVASRDIGRLVGAVVGRG